MKEKELLMKQESYCYEDLERIVRILRGEGGCPWDREQTHESLRICLLEESYEVAEAIDQKDPDHLREELGDLLLQVVFHEVIEEERGCFSSEDVITGVCRKMIHRHPHVFAAAEAMSAEAVPALWEEVKRKEKGAKTAAQTLSEVPLPLPALARAQKLQKKAEGLGLAGGKEEMALPFPSLAGKTPEEREALVGRVLFHAAAWAREAGVQSEIALEKQNRAFILDCLSGEEGREKAKKTDRM